MNDPLPNINILEDLGDKLQRAIRCERTDEMRPLLAGKSKDEIAAIINTRNKQGDTALIVAADLDNIKAVEILLHTGAAVDIHAANNRGETALSLALRNSGDEIVKLLIPRLGVGVTFKLVTELCDYICWLHGQFGSRSIFYRLSYYGENSLRAEINYARALLTALTGGDPTELESSSPAFEESPLNKMYADYRKHVAVEAAFAEAKRVRAPGF